jgi:mono/diheme cytochrome c family protein
MYLRQKSRILMLSTWAAVLTTPAFGQLVDETQAFNYIREGIHKSLTEQIGAGRGDVLTPDSSLFIINRDPFRAIRRGRQLFQRKFTVRQGRGPGVGDGAGDLDENNAIGAGLADSCAACHGRPRGAAGVGGDVATRPDSRDAPHLFGLGLKEMLADEITADLRAIRAQAIAEARAKGVAVTKPLSSKGILYGTISAAPDGSVGTFGVEGVDPDLRVRPFFRQGETISIREFIVGALNNEMGLQAEAPDLAAASAGEKVTTPSGMVLDGSTDAIEAPPTGASQIPVSLVDFLEFYLMNYFKPATYEQTSQTRQGLAVFKQIGCTTCHIQNLQIERDRRVADVETVYDPIKGILNGLFATATTSFVALNDGTQYPALKRPALKPFLVENIFTDFKRHDLGPAFHERNYDGTMQQQFLTAPLWGVGSTAPYGHDGRSINLTEVILRHGGEAQEARDNFAALPASQRRNVLDFLNSLVIFPPDDTASNLNPGDPQAPYFPQNGHGAISLNKLFNDPADLE